MFYRTALSYNRFGFKNHRRLNLFQTQFLHAGIRKVEEILQVLLGDLHLFPQHLLQIRQILLPTFH